MAKAIIVGAGIVGLGTARALRRRGWEVEVIEAGPLPNPNASSTDHHRLIRSHYPDPGYAARIPEAFRLWEALWADLGARHYVERGMLALSRSAGDWTDRSRAALDARSMPYDLLDPEDIARRFPAFETEGVRYGMMTRDGGALLAERILRGLMGRLVSEGVSLFAETPVEAVDPEAGAVVTATGIRHADRIIVAAGIATGRLVPALAPRLEPRRIVVLYADPPDRLRATWEETPCWIDLGNEDDLWGMPPMEGWPLKLGYGAHTRPGDPETERRLLPDDVPRILAAYEGRVKGIGDFTVRTPHVNFYTMAPQERFILHAEGLMLAASACSGHGFKFGLLSGEDIAEAADGGDVPAIARRMAGLA
ncbi:MAG: NAD(P)/FAD-dependent oxidoreductase [Rubricella sp.]